MVDVDGKVGAVLDVAEHQQGNKHNPADDQQRKETRLFTRLWDNKQGGAGEKGG